MTTTSSAVRAISLIRWLETKTVRPSPARWAGSRSQCPTGPPLSGQIGGHRAASVYDRQVSPAEAVSSA
jgi:hypothetical protein